jgi:predicted nucleotide-binding protein
VRREGYYRRGEVSTLNVIHEVGLSQRGLGFSRAIVLLEDGAEEFSNIHGIVQIRFGKGNIKETFGDVLATIKKRLDVRFSSPPKMLSPP